ncbi:hemerythrin domain-containing protein [Streptomyces sp. WMMC940]|uniref:hemerythrin domain-containing protein n=1 Tax=Streptomyces sp. WMMC940 TaxID=3015153 RepID=UPI0022B63ABA|nr:hemerythrin domain-containing protein [Streptomyces sp. WMMC940]MCZ7456530.1 hemerythrin domain-containing protein [Streptomyces sp. WMMC940]
MTSHDVVELILEDHRTMEDLLRRMRSIEADRAKALREFSRLLIAHGEAEESEVYPALRRYRKIDNDEVDHGEEEHAEGNEALLALLEADGAGDGEWDERLEKLVRAVGHHLDEEERTLLNEARRHVPEERRAELGEAFRRERDGLLASDCGAVENVRRLVKG